MHLDGKLPGICEKNPKISRNFETIIYKATEKKTINRYATAKEMLTDLKAAYQHPEEVIEYTNNDNGATLVIPKNEIKQIWSNKEYRSFGGEKDPYEKLIRWAAIASAFVVVAILTAIIVPANIHNWVPKMVTVPNLFNLNVEELSLRYPDLKYAIEGYVYSDEVTRGRIVEQDIKPLESVKAESIIGVIVSKGVEEKPVPDVLNFSYSEAEKKLREQGFSVEQIIENNNTAAIGNVFRQSPAADSLLPKGGIVTIYVSKGAEVELVEVPPLINQPKQEAIARLTELGFIVNVSESYNDHYEKGRVVMMSIAPGNKVVKGSSIDLSVSLGKEFISKKMEIRINSPFGPVQESGIIKVTLTQGDTEKVLLEAEVRIDQFPLMLTPEGTGTGIITVYLDGVKQYTRQIVFTEE